MSTCETCRYYMASPLQEPCDRCRWNGVIGQDPTNPTNWEAPTNADRIMAMTDEELAEYLSNICYDLWKMFVDDPKKMWLDWLKSPVEDREVDE